MKLFWKIYFSSMFTMVICVVLCGYLLIDIGTDSRLNTEVETARKYSNIIYYSLADKLEDTDPFFIAENSPSDAVYQTLKSFTINSFNQEIRFLLMDQKGNTVYSSLALSLDKDILSSVNTEESAWRLVQNGSHYYIQTVRPALYFDTLFYIETARDITYIFNDQHTQYKILVQITVVMTVLAGLVTFVISKLLLRRINALSAITKTISGGNLSKRASCLGNDEISDLSTSFNSMADSLEDKIQQLSEEAERKELFVASFSHELKTPLTSIIGYSDLLRRKELTSQQRHICADYIFSEGKRLERLSMRLLDLIVLKKQVLNIIPTQLKALMFEVRAVVYPQIANSDIKLAFDIEPTVISMEPELMKTVFINIIDNARKAFEQSGKIVVRGRSHGGIYTLTIRDNGKGMTQQDISKITDPFYMADKSRSRKQGGAGLGLSICKEILHLHNFDISFDSIINEGTTVTIMMKEDI